MTPDERVMARFEREQQRRLKGASLFDLEEANDDVELTHMGRALNFDGDDVQDDYDAASIQGSDEDDELRRKRKRGSNEDDENGNDAPKRKKSRAEIMKEVVTKSKLHKHERQQAKEDDDELRMNLDKDLPSVLAALRAHPDKSEPPRVTAEVSRQDAPVNPDRAELIAGKSREVVDREYDSLVRQLQLDKRAKPTDRTKTEEEKAQEEADRLKDLEQKRMKRMKGEPESDSGLSDQEGDESDANHSASEKALGTTGSVKMRRSRPEGVDDEDDFLLDDDLVASSTASELEDDMGSYEEDSDQAPTEHDGMNVDEDEDLRDVRPEPAEPGAADSSELAYIYPCPRSHAELLRVFQDISPADTPTVVQRIRALYNPKANKDNKAKLADFACALVDHVSHLGDKQPAIPLAIVEMLIRHIHSLSRSFPLQIAIRFRQHLRDLKELPAETTLSPGALMLLTAIGTIYPTSDRFHVVTTPAMTLMARWLGLFAPQSATDVVTAAYVGALCLRYQQLARRYVPELIRATTLCLKSSYASPDLVHSHLTNVTQMVELWHDKTALVEMFPDELVQLLQPADSGRQSPTFDHQKATYEAVRTLLDRARRARRPLELHHHRPLPIKTYAPKLDPEFDPSAPRRRRNEAGSTDPADAARLQHVYKRERKAVLRELRKDARFLAAHQLRDQRDKDRAYHAKFRRLVAEIQGDEGREANEYRRDRDRAKRARKKT